MHKFELFIKIIMKYHHQKSGKYEHVCHLKNLLWTSISFVTSIFFEINGYGYN